MKYSFICAATDMGVNIDGAKDGALQIIKNFNKDNPIIVNNNLNYVKNYNKNDREKNLEEINNYNLKLFNVVTNIIKNKKMPITIGGDHSIAIGSALAACTIYDKIGIIWIDSHTDYNTLETTITGNIHGIPLAAIEGHNKKEVTKHLKPNYINKENIVIVGARSIDKLEMDNLKKDNITIFTTNDIKKFGTKYIMDKAFEIASKNTNKVHISYDLDIIDPEICPGVSVKEINGINEKEAFGIMNYIKNKEDIISSIDLVEYNSLLDINEKSLKIALNLINIFINE